MVLHSEQMRWQDKTALQIRCDDSRDGKLERSDRSLRTFLRVTSLLDRGIYNIAPGTKLCMVHE